MDLYISRSLTFITLWFCFLVSTHCDVLPEIRNENYACFGTDVDTSFLAANCSNEEVIAVDLFWAGAKTINSGCPVISVTNNPSDKEVCCKPDRDTDCLQIYAGINSENTRANYYTRCAGKSMCDMLQVARMDNANVCNTSVYFAQTNYLSIIYYCITKNDITDGNNASLVTDYANDFKAIHYFWNEGYPDAMQPDVEQYTCSIITTDNRADPRIEVIALDIRFVAENEKCDYDMTISDGKTEHKIDCVNNLPKRIEAIYTTETRFLCIEINHIGNSSGTGHFWFGAMGSSLKIDCPSTLDIKKCIVEDMVTTPSTVTTDTYVSGIISARPTHVAALEDDSSNLGMILGIVIGIVLLIIIIVIVLVKRYCWNKGESKRESLTGDEESEDIESGSRAEEDFIFPEVLGKNNTLPPMNPPALTKIKILTRENSNHFIPEIHNSAVSGDSIEKSFSGKPTAAVIPLLAPVLAPIASEKKEKRKRKHRKKSVVDALEEDGTNAELATSDPSRTDGTVKKKKKKKHKKHSESHENVDHEDSYPNTTADEVEHKKKKRHENVDHEDSYPNTTADEVEHKKKKKRHHKKSNKIQPIESSETTKEN